MESAETINKLGSMPIGSRLMVRSKNDWRVACISRINEDVVTISVLSVSGRTYRIRRNVGAEIKVDGNIPALNTDNTDTWRDNFSPIDVRW